MKIGVFDSGRGGEFVADGLRKLLPHHDYIVVNDTAHVPYGARSNEEIIALTTAALAPLIAACPIIVIACNTATMAAIATLRARYPDTQFVGTEPMVKPAAEQSRSGHVTLLATPTTLRSERYRHLIDSYASHLRIDKPDTSGWARHIEDHQLAAIDPTDVAKSVDAGSDTVILACTHYIALVPQLYEMFPSITVLEPTDAIARRLTQLTSDN